MPIEPRIGARDGRSRQTAKRTDDRLRSGEIPRRKPGARDARSARKKVLPPERRPALCRGPVLLLLLFSPAILSAQLPNGRNHPELRWRTFDTPRFRIIYHQGLDSLAREAAGVAESLHDSVCHSLGARNMGRTSLILCDADDIPNGIANPLDHSIFIWMTGATRETTDSLRWLDRVIGHEFGHIAAFQAVRTWSGKPGQLLTLGLTPLWFLEGTAQWVSENWDAHRNLLVRAANRSGALLPMKKMDGFLVADPVDGRLVYEQGHGLVRHIAQVYGPGTIPEIIRRHRKFPFSFDRAVRGATGLPQAELGRRWKAGMDSLHGRSGRFETRDRMGGTMEIPLQVVTGVAFSPDGRIAAVGMERWDEGVQRLIVRDDHGRWERRGGPHAGSRISFSPDGREIVTGRRRRGRHGSVITDLFLVDVQSGKERRLTSDARASDPAWSPSGAGIVFVRRTAGGSELARIDLRTQEISLLFSPGPGGEVFAPVFSPDGESLAFSLFGADGRRLIAVVGHDGSGYRELTDGHIDARSPAWSPDGRWIAFCTYEAGTPDLARMRPDGSGKIRMTAADGGLFSPVWHPRGDSVAAVVFERRDRVRAVLIDAGREIRRPGSGSAEPGAHPVPVWAYADPFPIPRVQNGDRGDYGASRPYPAAAHVRPHLIIPFAGMDDAGIQFGVAGYASDPLRIHQILGFVTARRRTDIFLNYTYARLTPVIDFAAWQTTLGRTDFFRAPGGGGLWERRSGASVTSTWPLNLGRTLLSNHVFSLRGATEEIRELHPGRYAVFDPVFRPYSGNVHTIGASWAWAWSRPDIGYDIHPMTGAGAFIVLDRSFDGSGGGIDRIRIRSGVTGRRELPWMRHVAAVRIQALWSEGEHPIQDRARLGAVQPVRGLRADREGDRIVAGSAEYRMNLIRDLGLRIPFLYVERIALAFWTDWGCAWGRTLIGRRTGERLRFRAADRVITWGPEIRIRTFLAGKLNVTVRTGYGSGLSGQAGGRGYLLIGGVF